MNYDKLFIGGDWVDSQSADWIEVENPTSLEIIAKVPAANEKDVDLAVQAAADAFPTWRYSSLEERIRVVEQTYQLMAERLEEIAQLEVAELGAPIVWSRNAHAKGPVKRIQHFLKIFKDFSWEEKFPKSRVIKEPVGVVAAITPWNYPLGQIVQKVIPALLTGNTVVLKPSQNTPLSAYILCQAFADAGLPKGVLNMVTGRGGEVGNRLATHPQVDMVSFTGSTSGGKEVAKLAMDSVKKVALELGGKSPMVVLEGADYELAVQSALESVFYNTGQTCAALTRMIVPQKDLPQIESLVLQYAKEYVVGNPSEEKIHIGPLSSRKQFDKVKGYLEKGIEEGATLLLGEIPSDWEQGYFVKPAVFTKVKNSMTIAQEEIFGPVLCLIPYESAEEALDIANDSIYGLSGAVLGPEEQAKKMALALRTGSVYVNESPWDPDAPFGGYKQSGFGREGGLYGLEEFVQLKTMFDH